MKCFVGYVGTTPACIMLYFHGQNPFLVQIRSSGNVNDSLRLQLPLCIFVTNSWKSGAILNTENEVYLERMLRSETASKPRVARFQKSGCYMFQFFCYSLINLSQREYRKITSISASLFLCVWYFISTVWILQHLAPVLQPFPEVHWRWGSPKLAWLPLCLQHVPAGLSADSVWAALHVHVPCSGAEAENCPDRPCVQEGEPAAPSLALLLF